MSAHEQEEDPDELRADLEAALAGMTPKSSRAPRNGGGASSGRGSPTGTRSSTTS